MISVLMRMSQVGWHERSRYASMHIHEQDSIGVPGTLGADMGLQALVSVCFSLLSPSHWHRTHGHLLERWYTSGLA